MNTKNKHKIKVGDLVGRYPKLSPCLDAQTVPKTALGLVMSISTCIDDDVADVLWSNIGAVECWIEYLRPV